MTGTSLRVLMLGAVNSPHLVQLATEMRGHGFEVHVAGYVSPSVPAVDFAALGIPLHVIPTRALRSGGLPVHVRGVRRVLREVQPDVVHAHSVSYFCWSAALAGASPLISTAWGSDVYLAGRLGRAEIRFALARSVWATADSPELLERLHRLGAPPERTSVIGWGVDLAAFTPAADRTALREHLGLGAGPLILGPRSLKPIYNPEVLVGAFERVRREVPQAQLLLKHLDAGPPPPGLQREGVTIVGHVPYEQMADYYRAADVCVSIPSSDSAPRSVWEAMAAGAPCVLSDLPWVHSMLTPGSEALVSAIDADAVASAVSRVLLEPELAAGLSARGRAFVEAREDSRVHMRRLADLYRQVASA